MFVDKKCSLPPKAAPFGGGGCFLALLGGIHYSVGYLREERLNNSHELKFTFPCEIHKGMT